MSLCFAELPHWPGDSSSALPTGVKVFELVNSKGVRATFTNHGAALISAKAPSKTSVAAEELTLNYLGSFDDFKAKSPYYGVTVGRVANRIAGGTFDLDGATYKLATNNGPNALHGGVKGFDKLLWEAKTFKDEAAGAVGVEFALVSPDGDEGYPGELTAKAVYSLNEDNEITMAFSANVTGKATPVNLCNHAYWNLSGDFKRSARDHRLTLACSHYLPVDDTLIPTGEIRSVAGTPFDFFSEGKAGKLIGADIEAVTSATEGIYGYDHCFVAKAAVDAAAASGGGGETKQPPSALPLTVIAVLEEPVSGRRMTVSTTKPAVQCYSGNFLSKDPSDAPHTVHNAVCLETENFPDAIHRQGQFPDCVLRPGQTYEHTTVHKFEWYRC